MNLFSCNSGEQKSILIVLVGQHSYMRLQIRIVSLAFPGSSSPWLMVFNTHLQTTSLQTPVVLSCFLLLNSPFLLPSSYKDPMIPWAPSRIISTDQDPSFNHTGKVPLAKSGTIFTGFRGWDVDIFGRREGRGSHCLSHSSSFSPTGCQFLLDTKLRAGDAKMPALQRPFPGKLNS